MTKFGLASNHLDSNLKETSAFLNSIAAKGFDFYELEITNYSLMANHTWIKKREDDFISALRDIPLEYSLHLPLLLDLGDSEDKSHYQDLFKSFVEFANELKIKDFVLHPSRYKDSNAVNEETVQLRALAPLFRDAGIKVHLENLLNQKYNGCYSYNVAINDNIRLLNELDEPCYGYCFDFGHANITTKFREENLVEEFDRAFEYTTHLHIHDNFGKIPEEGKKLNKHESAMLGFGDMHMPPGWGDVPYQELRGHLALYEGKAVIELFKDYLDDLDDILATTKALFIPQG